MSKAYHNVYTVFYSILRFILLNRNETIEWMQETEWKISQKDLKQM